jgi:hypothetical protein
MMPITMHMKKTVVITTIIAIIIINVIINNAVNAPMRKDVVQNLLVSALIQKVIKLLPKEMLHMLKDVQHVPGENVPIQRAAIPRQLEMLHMRKVAELKRLVRVPM